MVTAAMEAALILILIAQRYKVSMVPGHAPIQPKPSVSLRIKGGLKMKILDKQ